MAISVSKKKSRLSRKVKAREFTFLFWILTKALFRIPALVVFLILIFLWTSTATILSGKIVHFCIASGKLNKLHCISAGTQPTVEIPIPQTNGSSISSGAAEGNDNSPQVVNVLERSLPTVYEGSKRDKYDEFATSTSGRIKPNSEDVAHAVLENSILTASSNSSEKESKDSNEELTTSYSTQINNSANKIGNIPAENWVRFIYNISDEYRNEELATAYMHAEKQLQVHRSWISSNQNHGNCDGSGVYVYELPSKFNKDLLAQCGDMMPWVNLCKHFGNDALGERIEKLGKGWYQTHQYALEPIFHSRVLKHPCRVYNENEANLFYVPFYGGLDILRWHFKNVSEDVKDTLGLELVRWLETQRPWFQKLGKDHVFILGKISWDFRRESPSSWGSRFLELDEMQNPIKILIERQPWHVNDIGIPHPTYFHPQRDDDIITWQLKIIRSYRQNLVSFAGAARPGSPESIRSILIEQCTTTANGECRFLDCNSGACDQPESLIDLFMESQFCLQPPGDSPTRKSVFDSLISGCIPVIFHPLTAYYQYPWHLPEDYQKYSVYIDKDELRSKNMNVIQRLAKISQKERENMRRYIVYKLLPGLVYADPNSQLEKFQDAFSITMNNLIERMNRL